MFRGKEHVPVFSAGCMTREAVFTEAAETPGIGALTPATDTRASSTAHLALWVDTVLGWCGRALAPIPFPATKALALACFTLSMPCNKDTPAPKLLGLHSWWSVSKCEFPFHLHGNTRLVKWMETASFSTCLR